MAYRGSLWGLPMAMKSLALYYRSDLVAEPPKTTDELMKLVPAMKAKRGYALAYANVDLYGHAAWLHGFGGRVIPADFTRERKNLRQGVLGHFDQAVVWHVGDHDLAGSRGGDVNIIQPNA